MVALLLLFASHLVPGARAAIGPVGIVTVGAGLWAVAGGRVLLWVGVALALPALANGAIAYFTEPGGAAKLGGSSFHVPFFMFAAAVVGNAVVRAEHTTADTLAGAACAWLLLALTFASAYASLESAGPGTFAFAHGRPEEGLYGWMLHFSLVAITTLGYGDVTPVGPLARSIVTFESVLGVLYPSIVVARLVSVATAGGGRPFTRPDVGGPTTAGWVALGLSAGIVVAPWASGEARLAVLAVAAIGALLIAALMSISGRRRLPAAATAFILAALALRLIPGWEGLAPVFDFGFLGLVVGVVGLRLVRADRVTHEVLLAAPALYLLIGYAGASAFAVLHALDPGALAGPEGTGWDAAELLYLSFMTLTTTGFGDITPVAAPARALAGALAATGIFFPAVMVARLVSLYEVE